MNTLIIIPVLNKTDLPIAELAYFTLEERFRTTNVKIAVLEGIDISRYPWRIKPSIIKLPLMDKPLDWLYSYVEYDKIICFYKSVFTSTENLDTLLDIEDGDYTINDFTNIKVISPNKEAVIRALDNTLEVNKGTISYKDVINSELAIRRLILYPQKVIDMMFSTNEMYQSLIDDLMEK